MSIHRANLRNIIIFEKFINLTNFNLFVKKFCSSAICMRMNQREKIKEQKKTKTKQTKKAKLPTEKKKFLKFDDFSCSNRLFI